jgi:hypothetical protein
METTEAPAKGRLPEIITPSRAEFTREVAGSNQPAHGPEFLHSGVSLVRSLRVSKPPL